MHREYCLERACYIQKRECEDERGMKIMRFRGLEARVVQRASSEENYVETETKGKDAKSDYVLITDIEIAQEKGNFKNF